MKKILTFELFEAQYSYHFEKRVQERILNLSQISIDSISTETVEKKIESEVGPEWKQLLIDSIVSNTEKRIFSRIKLPNFDPKKNFAVPISFLTLEFEGKIHPIQISSYSSKGDDEQSLYEGSQIWAAVSGDIAWTLKIFDESKSLDSIAFNMRQGISERYRIYPFVLQRPENNFKVKFSWDSKTQTFQSNDEEERVEAPILNKPIPERRTLSVGDTIGLIIKSISPDKLTYGKIEEIINIGEIRDKQKIASLSDVDSIKLKFLPLDKSNWVKRGESPMPIPYQPSLRGGSVIGIEGEEYTILGPKEGKPLITSEPSIINSGRIQTWVERITSSSS